MKRIHTYRHQVLGKGPIKQHPIKIRIWFWGFAFSYLTNKHMGGLVLTAKKTPHPTRPIADSYTQKYPQKRHKK
jgi:aconitase B